MNLISVIVTTYNWPAALTLCLESLFVQQDKNFEIIIADDGSSENNLETAKGCCKDSPISLSYIHHDDKGFRAGTIRNKAVAICKGEYLLFIDGDCIVLPDFIGKHRHLALQGFFVPGNRVLLSQEFTQEVIDKHLALYAKPIGHFIFLWLQKGCL